MMRITNLLAFLALFGMLGASNYYVIVNNQGQFTLSPLSAQSPIVLTNGNTLSCPTCQTSASGVSSLNGLTGAISLIPLNDLYITGSGTKLYLNVPPPYNSAYQTSTYNSNYDSVILNYFPFNNLKAGGNVIISGNVITALANTYNSQYATSTYNANYQSILSNYVPYVSQGTGITVNAFNGIINSGVTSLVAGGNVVISGSTGAVTVTALAVSDNSFYDHILSNYVPTIGQGTGILISTTNTITATGYNSVYDAKPSSTYNSFYDHILSNYVPSISQGTSITVSTTNQISLGTLTLSEIPVNMMYTYNSAYLTSSSSYNSVYDHILSNYVPTLGQGTGILISATNTISATGYNSAYWTGTNYNSLYVTSSSSYNSFYDHILSNYVPTIGQGTGILISTTNSISATGYNSVYGSILSNYVPTVTAGGGISVSTTNAITATGVPSVTAGNSILISPGNTISLNQQAGVDSLTTNIIQFQALGNSQLPATTLFTSGNAVANTDSAFWAVSIGINSLGSTNGYWEYATNSLSTGIANIWSYNTPVVGASNSFLPQFLIPYSENIMFVWGGGVNTVVSNVMKWQ